MADTPESKPAPRVVIPQNLPELISSEGKAQLAAAEMLLNALSRLQLVVIDSAGVQHTGVIQISGASAILRIKL